jgi:hypothetical protein
MSYSSQNRAIQPFKLLGESFSQVGPVYLPLLLLAIPATVLSMGDAFTSSPKPSMTSSVLLTLTLVVTYLLFGGTFLIAYRYIKQGTLDVAGSIQQGLQASAKILFGGMVYSLAIVIGLLLFVVPGIYLAVALGFFAYGILTENYSIPDSFKYSLALVKGRWWATFGSLLVQMLLIIPLVFLSWLVGTVIGTAIVIAGSKVASIELWGNVASALMSAIITPILDIYNAKIYSRLQETIQRSPADNQIS